MAEMGIPRLVHSNLIYKIRDLMEDYGYSSYKVIDRYPNISDLNTDITFPTVSVEITQQFGRGVEIGSKAWPTFSFAIDVFARTDQERDDLSYYLWDSLEEYTGNLYNFNSAFPSSVGDYTGIYPYNYTAEYYIDNMSVVNLVPVESEYTGEQHRATLDGFVYVPNLRR